MKTNRTTKMLALLAACAALTGCGGGSAQNLMTGITARDVSAKSVDDTFLSAQYDFALGLLRGEASRNGDSNIVIAPFSLAQTLAMSANGAKGSTRDGLETVLGLPVAELNDYFAGITVPRNNLEKQRMLSASSIWIREMDGLHVVPEFLQTNADCYGADVFTGDFGKDTVDAMNDWFSLKTAGSFKDAVQELDANTVLCLLNALSFEYEWDEKYEKSDIKSGDFHPTNDTSQQAEYMNSNEDVFLWSEDAVGFTKPYKTSGQHNYEFLAVLPNEDLTLDAYLQTLTADSFPQPLEKACSRAGLPKFGFESDTVLNDTLIAMGLADAFSGDTADFTGMATTAAGNIYIGKVQQKVRIDVDDEGTKAEGITIQQQAVSSADPAPEGQQRVYLNRPFLFMIRDADTRVPLFAGIVRHIE